ncbi:hypothetical protein EDB89DRAFT_2073940 [Lactarius sanguifluus]|nr:hypothetical protein EDB89DRAFT_2073940 [Lactarius sanguifluus]
MFDSSLQKTLSSSHPSSSLIDTLIFPNQGHTQNTYLYSHTSRWVSHPLTLTSGRDRLAMCWSCSHTFASIVKELDNDLTRTICHLVPIEDDISILDDTQQPLRSFDEKSIALNWHTVLSLGFHASIHLPRDG